jgi:hypothetical protein
MDNTQSPFLSQEGVQELAEQQLETITGGGPKVVSHQEFGKTYADAYNSASEHLRQPFLTSNQSAANQVSGRQLAGEKEKPLHEGFFPPVYTIIPNTGNVRVDPSKYANDEYRAIFKKNG